MVRAKIGDVFLVNGLPGYAYIQYIRKYDEFGALVRIFSTIHSRPCELAEIVKTPGPRYFYHVDAALKAPALIELAGSAPLSAEDQGAIKFRSHSRKGPWQLYEEGKPRRVVTTLSEEESRWDKMYAMISQQTLLNSILRANGIRPDGKQVALSGGESNEPIENDQSLFFLYFSNEDDANRAASTITSDGMLSAFSSHISSSTTGWQLRLNAKMHSATPDVQRRLTRLAADFGGLNDGFEIPVKRRKN